MPRPLADCRLYTFIDTAYLDGRSPVGVTRQLCDGGSDLIQLRAKNLPKAEVRAIVESMAPVTEDAGVHLIINDYPDIAQSLPSPFVHLGQEDFFEHGYSQASDLFPDSPRPMIGLSTHEPSQCQRAIEAGADYVAIGPVYATGTKPTAKPATLNYVRWAAAHVNIPWFAIGGINLETLSEVLSAGARRICIVSAILQHEHPDKACQSIRQLLPS
ncbi:MAG: Thiamine-phosphate synthase [Verrucomicrobia subdivision 3 bacterium]|nr:Thiamine-phosphate synthase [Limisphaerales bacterium]MCS1415731.1 Thiamine-phosphate synthase [Limisphaerales bacterium]